MRPGYTQVVTGERVARNGKKSKRKPRGGLEFREVGFPGQDMRAELV